MTQITPEVLEELGFRNHPSFAESYTKDIRINKNGETTVEMVIMFKPRTREYEMRLVIYTYKYGGTSNYYAVEPLELNIETKEELQVFLKVLTHNTKKEKRT